MEAVCTCNQNRRVTVNATLRADPTRTLTLRNRFVAEMNKRFRRIRQDMWTSIVVNDSFGLREQPASPQIRSVGDLIAQEAALPQAWSFPSNAEKIEAFQAWLQEQIDSNILETVPGPGIQFRGAGVRQQVPWTNQYIQPAYERGVIRADNELRRLGIEVPVVPIEVTMQGPVHADAVAIIYTRTFSELRGVTAAMDQQISRALATALAEGQGPLEIARRIADRIDKIGITRARAIARTEIIHAHHQANINEYQQFGIEGVEVQAEWATAGDGRVCVICQDLEGRVFTLDRIRGMIPAHPNCRCAAIPVLPESRRRRR